MLYRCYVVVVYVLTQQFCVRCRTEGSPAPMCTGFYSAVWWHRETEMNVQYLTGVVFDSTIRDTWWGANAVLSLDGVTTLGDASAIAMRNVAGNMCHSISSPAFMCIRITQPYIA